MDKTIYLIRHANTPGTEQRLFYGSTDLPITEAGRQEVLAKNKSGLYPDLRDSKGENSEQASCYTSGMLRTEQTFEAIYGDTPHEYIHDLREIELGDFEMKSLEEVRATPYGAKWIAGEVTKFDFEGGDSYDGFMERVHRGLTTLREDENPRVIVVIHGAVICAIMDELFPEEKENLFDWTPAPSSGYEILFKDNKPVMYQTIALEQ